jgi:uncharacterized membrane protein YuzA (DUF378 family)
MRTLYWILLVILAIGGINWLLVGAFDFDLVAALFGEMSALSRIVYVLVGIAAVGVLAMTSRMTSHGRLEARP